MAHILPEAKQLANEYMVTDEEANDYLLAGFSYEQCKVFCELRSAGWKHTDVMDAIVAVRSCKEW